MGFNSKNFALLFLMASMIQIGCSNGGGVTSATPIPVDEKQFFDLGLKGEPSFDTANYVGDLSLEFSYDGKTSTNPAGQLELGFVRSGDQIAITYSLYLTGTADPTTSSYLLTIQGNSLEKHGQKQGKIGSFSMEIKDQKWTYRFVKAISVDDGKTPVIKVTAHTEQAGQVATYTGILKLK
jgi:hypothetical protein